MQERSGGIQKFRVDKGALIDAVLNHMSKKLKSNDPLIMKVLLGGTAPMETRVMINILDQCAAKVGGEWKFEIVGYSIDPTILLNIERALTNDPPPLKLEIRLEFIDLLNPNDRVRMKAELPDMVLTVNSLYLGELFTSARFPENLGERLPLFLDYIKDVTEMLLPGGIFVVEAPYKSLPIQGLSEMPAVSCKFSGVYRK